LGHGKLVQATSEGDLYCPTCKRVETSFQLSFKLQLNAIYDNKLETFVVYDENVDTLFGCSADQFNEVRHDQKNRIYYLLLISTKST
jgi:hypothetical protein